MPQYGFAIVSIYLLFRRLALESSASLPMDLCDIAGAGNKGGNSLSVGVCTSKIENRTKTRHNELNIKTKSICIVFVAHTYSSVLSAVSSRRRCGVGGVRFHFEEQHQLE